MPPRKRRLTTVHRILESARQKFAQFGFSKVTMDEIAREAGLGKASLYYYFPTKEDLFQAVVVRGHDEFLSSVQEIMNKNMSASDKLRSFIRKRSEYFNSLLDLNILDLRSSDIMKPVLRKTFDEFFEQELKVVQHILRQGRRTGEFASDISDKVAMTILDVMRGLRLRFLRTINEQRNGTDAAPLFGKQLSAMELFLRGMCTKYVAPGARKGNN